MIRLQFAGDDRPTPGLPEDQASEGWWGGVQLCMAGVAIAAGLATGATTAQAAQQVVQSHQDETPTAPTTLAVPDDRPVQVAPNLWILPPVQAIQDDGNDLGNLHLLPATDQETQGFRVLRVTPWLPTTFLQPTAGLDNTGYIGPFWNDEEAGPVLPPARLWPVPPVPILTADDEVVTPPTALQVDDEPGIPLGRTEWETVVSLWWDSSGPIEHAREDEGVAGPLPAPHLWSTPPAFILWPTDEVGTPPAPLQVDQDDWRNPVAPSLWPTPPVGLVPNVPDEWPTPPAPPLTPDDDSWEVLGVPPEAPANRPLYLYPQEEAITPPVPLGIEEGVWQSLVAPQLWPTPSIGLVSLEGDEWPTPPPVVPLQVDQDGWRNPVAPVLWWVPPTMAIRLEEDWMTGLGYAVLVYDYSQSRWIVTDESGALYRVEDMHP